MAGKQYTDDMTEIATFANGCFWCTEAVFKRLRGVISVMSGYAGGTVANPTYEQVCTGETGHAESLQIEFDPTVIPYSVLLEVFWHTHNPTILNQQGNDVGTQYRSVIFYRDINQKEVAEKSKLAFEKENVYNRPIVTEIIPFTNFYQASDYHKNYFDRNSNVPYCNFIISPKIHKLLEKYGRDVKEEYKK